MIGISKLYCGAVEASDPLRYGRRSGDLPSHLLQFSADKKPVVVWNVTRRCNLKCVHCYSHSEDKNYGGELSNKEGKALIEDLSEFGSPVILFSGGEPLIRPDILELIQYAVQMGRRAVVSTNGTLITERVATKLQEIGLSYVGISLDGLENVHDAFRGFEGTFKRVMTAIKNCQSVGLKVGLRFTINKRNYQDIPGIFDLVEERNIPRICFYHLVYAGRGTELVNEDLDHSQTREVVDIIMDRTKDLHDKGLPVEVLTVDNHADGPYLYLRLTREDPERAEEVLKLLQMNEGNNSGRGIGCISWDGSVHADQFWRHHSFGNVREKRFSQIWTEPADEFLMKLKDKKKHVKGRCAACRWLSICGGNFRVRAEAIHGDVWAPDPACYLTDQEIGL
ncbi:MAG: 12,18-didecarboxysiroheme deacetylase [Desulfomonile tiedjei]|uniref:Pre-heme d1 synthase n=1 Tax=Desulfomonile tiedjei TaxID=2358 RepID=A0A9D6Z2C7_9BACT|nr:12,18-didecarboxysiroheme deacetylase [Desulfomonile tiedjei]